MSTKSFDNYADLITFSRASSATYLDSDGLLKTATTNTPRIEYDANGNRLGLLIEEQRTNFIEWSNVFSQWDLTRATITENVEISPDGTQNATLFTATGDDARIQYSAGDINTVNTASIWVKSATESNVAVQMDNGGLDIDLFTATTEWQRLENVLSTTGVANPRCRLRILNSGDSIYIYQGQLEAGSFMTSAIPTSGSTATRAADVASIPTSDFGFNQKQGSVVVEFTNFQDTASSGSRGVVGTSLEGRFAYVNAEKTRTFDGTTVVAASPNVSENTLIKTASAFKNDQAISTNGSAVATGAFDGTWSNDGFLYIGRIASSLLMSGHIKSLKYYPRRLSNDQLQELTQ